MTSPVVSIITPAYNSASYIAETIASALDQTFTSFELIVSDDGSTDSTLDVVRRAAAGDPRVVITGTSHGGAAVARNAAFTIARGRFIALLDSDDIWMPGYLSEQLRIVENCPGTAVVTANAISLGGGLDGKPLWPTTSGLRVLALRDLIIEDNAVCIMSVFRREAFERVGGFDPTFNGNEDYEFWLKTTNAGFGIVQNLRPLCFYRRRPGSVSSDEVRTLVGIIRVLESVATRGGPLECERELIAHKLTQLNDALALARLRASLNRRDARDAALRLKDLSELRGSACLAIAAKVTQVWPQLLLHAYGLRQSLRA